MTYLLRAWPVAQAILVMVLLVDSGRAAEKVAFSAATGRLAIAQREDVVRVVAAGTAKEQWSQNVFQLTVGPKTTPMKSISAVAFTADGKTLAVGGGVLYHGHVVLLDAASGKPAHLIRCIGLSEFVVLAFSPDGKTLAAGAPFGPGFLFDVKTGERKHKLDTKGFVGVAFSGDGTLVAGACVDEHNSDNVKRD